MKYRIKLSLIVLATLLTSLPILSFADGGSDGGGGDICEDRIKVIRDDIHAWIIKGGPNNGLNLEGVSLELYSSSMLEKIVTTKIKCVGPGDDGYPVEVFGTPKACRYQKLQQGNQIICDYQKFNLTGESDQYVLVHHEYAGLADVEIPNKDDSNYQVSNQISGYLEDRLIKTLSIKPKQTCQKLCTIDGPEGTGNYVRIYINDLDSGTSKKITTVDNLKEADEIVENLVKQNFCAPDYPTRTKPQVTCPAPINKICLLSGPDGSGYYIRIYIMDMSDSLPEQKKNFLVSTVHDMKRAKKIIENLRALNYCK